MESVTFRCGSCNRLMKAPADKVGRLAKCPQCAHTMPIPAGATATAPGRSVPIPGKQRPPAPGKSAPLAGTTDDEVVKPEPQWLDDPNQEEDDPDYAVVAPESLSRRGRPRDQDADEADDDDQEVLPRRGATRREEADDDDEDDAPRTRRRRPKRRADKGDWPKVHIGMKLIFLAVIIQVVLVGVGFVGGLIGAAQLRAQKAQEPLAEVKSLKTFTVIVGVGNLLQLVLATAGYVFCVYLPAKHAAKVLAFTTLALAVSTITLIMVANGIPGVGDQPVRPGGMAVEPPKLDLALLANVVDFARLVAFMLLLRSIGVILKAEDLVQSIKKWFILCGCVVGIWIGLFVMAVVLGFGAAAAGGRAAPAAGLMGLGLMAMLGGCVTLICLLVAFIWYIFIVREAVNVVAEKVRRL